MIFYKTSSFGNDFIEIDLADVPDGIEQGEVARAVCDRQRGVGADGVVFYWQGRKIAVPLGDRRTHRIAVPSWDRRTHRIAVPLGDRRRGDGWSFAIRNRDGGAAELSGNGMAGLAAVLFQRRLAPSPLPLRSAVGCRRVVLAGRRGPLFELDVEIGRPDFRDRSFFPFLARGQGAYRCGGVEFHPVAVGNPHAVVLCRQLPAAGRLEALGRRLEGHPLFPKRVNVEFVERPDGAGRCRVYFYERGVGPTQASSTGSAAVFAVLRGLGMAGERLEIECGQETLALRWQDGIHVRNRTRIVCRGEYFHRP